MAKKMQAKLCDLKRSLQQRLHDPVPAVGQWLAAVLRGHYRYYGVPGNRYALGRFRRQVTVLWYRALKRRSQRTRLTWERMNGLAKRYLLNPRIWHPYPKERLCV